MYLTNAIRESLQKVVRETNEDCVFNSSYDSDNEFWKELDDPAKSQDKKHQKLGDNHSSEAFYKSLGNWVSQKVQDQLNSLRKSAKDELVSQRIAVRNETRKEFIDTLEHLKGKFSGDVKHLMQDYEDLKLILAKRDREIAEIIKYLGDQEAIVGQFRIRPRKKQLDPQQLEKKTQDVRQSPVPDKSQIRALANKKHMLDELVYEYSNSISDTRLKIQELTQQNITDKLNYEQEIVRMNQKSKEYLDGYDSEYTALKQQIDKYKNCTEIELETREMISNKNNKIILALKEELKSAKEIIKSPNLKSKIHYRLQDYVKEEIQSSDNFTKEIKFQTNTVSTPYRRHIKTTLEKRRSRKESTEGQMMSLSMDRSNEVKVDESLIGTKVLGMPNGWKLQPNRRERFSNIGQNNL